MPTGAEGGRSGDGIWLPEILTTVPSIPVFIPKMQKDEVKMSRIGNTIVNRAVFFFMFSKGFFAVSITDKNITFLAVLPIIMYF
jgi:hypothetical protein